MADACMRCGSTRIVPDVPILDHYGDWGCSSKPSKLTVEQNPKALIFKESMSGTVHARVCGDCGYTELHTSNHRELYEAYLRASTPQA